MEELLDFEEKQYIKENYRNHPLYRLINQSCKKYEVRMPNLKFSPEEVFLGVLLRLEDFRDNPDEAESIIRLLHNDLICKYRERGDNIPDKEVLLAVLIVMCFLLLCLNSQDDSDCIKWMGCLSQVLVSNYGKEVQETIDAMIEELSSIENSDTLLADWVHSYLEDEECISTNLIVAMSPSSSYMLAEGQIGNFAKIIQVMYDLKMIIKADGTPATNVKDVAQNIGLSLGVSFDNWSQTLKGAFEQQNYLQSFIDMENAAKKYKSRKDG